MSTSNKNSWVPEVMQWKWSGMLRKEHCMSVKFADKLHTNSVKSYSLFFNENLHINPVKNIIPLTNNNL